MGGPRPGSGRKTRYPGKLSRIFCLKLTDEGQKIIDMLTTRHGASMSDVVEHLLRMNGGGVLRGLPPLPEAKH